MGVELVFSESLSEPCTVVSRAAARNSKKAKQQPATTQPRQCAKKEWFNRLFGRRTGSPLPLLFGYLIGLVGDLISQPGKSSRGARAG